MSEGKLINLEKTITKKDWVDIVSWISTRWQNLNWTDQEIKSLYENYKLFPKDVMWTTCLLYTSPSPRDLSTSRMPSSA